VIQVKALKLGHVGIGFCTSQKSVAPNEWLGSDAAGQSAAIWDNHLHHLGQASGYQTALKQGDIATVEINFPAQKIEFSLNGVAIPKIMWPPGSGLKIAFAACLCQGGDTVEIVRIGQ